MAVPESVVDPPAVSTLSGPELPRRRRWKRWVGGGAVVLGGVCVAGVALLPTLAGTAAGRRLAASQISQRIDGSVSIDGMTTRWFGGQRLEGVTLRDPDGAVVLTLASLELTDARLWDVAWGERDLGVARLSGLTLEVVKDAEGRTNLERALGGREDAAKGAKKGGEEPEPENADPARLPVNLDLELSDLVVSYREPDKAPVGARLTAGRVTLADAAVSAQFDARVNVGDDGGRVSGGMDSGPDALADPRWTGTVTAADLPLAALDAWVGADGYLTAVLGDAAGVTVTLDGWSPTRGGGVALRAESAAGTGAALRLIDDGATLRLAEAASLSLVQTPELSDKFTRLVNPILMPAVVSAVHPLRVTLDPAGFSMGSRGFDWSQVNARVRLDVGTVAVLPTREPFAGVAQQLQRFGVLKQASLYDLEVRPIELSVEGGTFRYAPQHFRLDDVTLTFEGLMNMTEGKLDVRLIPGGREIDRDPLLRALVNEGVRIAGPLDAPVVEMGSVLDGLKEENLGNTLVNVLGGFLERESRKKDRPSKEDSQ